MPTLHILGHAQKYRDQHNIGDCVLYSETFPELNIFSQLKHFCNHTHSAAGSYQIKLLMIDTQHCTNNSVKPE